MVQNMLIVWLINIEKNRCQYLGSANSNTNVNVVSVDDVITINNSIDNWLILKRRNSSLQKQVGLGQSSILPNNCLRSSSDCHYLNKAGHQTQFDTMLLNKLIFVVGTQLHQISPNAMKKKLLQ
jgi:hypothetical protein